MRDVSYDRPVTAKLYVHLANGEKFEATATDLVKFGFIDPHAAYRDLSAWITAALERNGVEKAHDIRETGLCSIHYAVECALLYDEMPGAREGDEVAKLARVTFEEDGNVPA